jgi:hypothetical protein
VGVVPRRVGETTRNVERWGPEFKTRYRRVRPLVVMAVVAAWVGLWFELVRSWLRRRRPRTR